MIQVWTKSGDHCKRISFSDFAIYMLSMNILVKFTKTADSQTQNANILMLTKLSTYHKMSSVFMGFK